VWAGDFTELDESIDGCFGYALSTRDLASRMHLLALPTLGEDADTAIAATESLFARHGAPLVYKSDNGSAFTSWDFRDMLDRWGVIALLSPPRTPRYNGAAEAGIGSFKTRTFYQAVRHGTREWTSDDAEAARQQCNQSVRRFDGGAICTPQERWTGRALITDPQREAFRRAARAHREAYLRENGLHEEPLESLPTRTRALVARMAIRRALESCGYLWVSRKRITPPFKSPLRARIR
jgi:hypothetical protein